MPQLMQLAFLEIPKLGARPQQRFASKKTHQYNRLGHHTQHSKHSKPATRTRLCYSSITCCFGCLELVFLEGAQLRQGNCVDRSHDRSDLTTDHTCWLGEPDTREPKEKLCSGTAAGLEEIPIAAACTPSRAACLRQSVKRAVDSTHSKKAQHQAA